MKLQKDIAAIVAGVTRNIAASAGMMNKQPNIGAEPSGPAANSERK